MFNWSGSRLTLSISFLITVKFENVMFESRKEDAQIKVIDFGLSKKFFAGEQDIMKEGVGTLYTMAPQVLQGVYSSQADLWSVGVMTYMLLSSHRPFYNKKRRVMIDNIMRADYNLKSVYWNPISNEAKDMVNSLLIVDPSKRMNASEALEHKWLSKEFNLSDRKPDVSVENEVKASLVSFRHTSELKKIALNVSTFLDATIAEVNITFQQIFLVCLSDFSVGLFQLQVIAHKSSTDEILHLRKAFDQYDSSNDGIISFEEFKASLEQLHYSEETMKDIFKSVVSTPFCIGDFSEFATCLFLTFLLPNQLLTNVNLAALGCE
jgi:calcium-dependent protein kinase